VDSIGNGQLIKGVGLESELGSQQSVMIIFLTILNITHKEWTQVFKILV